MRGTLFVVATPIGNLDDVSARALRVLREVALIAAEDTRRTSHLLARYGIRTPTTSLHEHNERQKTPRLLSRLRAGDAVALVSDAGTPTVSDPGRRLVQAAVEAGAKVESIPGPSAVLCALAASGFAADSFVFLGFPPTRSKDRIEWFSRLKAATGTVVFFEAPHRISRTLDQIQALLGDVNGLAGRELTKQHEELVRGPISALIKGLQLPRGEITLVLDLGQSTEISLKSGPQSPVAGPAASSILDEFGQLIQSGCVTRREAVTLLARRHGLRGNAVYALIESTREAAPDPLA